MGCQVIGIVKCAECGGRGELIKYFSSLSLYWVSCYQGQMSGAHAPGAAGLWRTEREAVAAWNTYQERANEIKSAREAWAVVVEELGLTSEFPSAADHAEICDALRELNALAAETLSAREDALRHEGRADYLEALLTRLLATRQGRTVGYEPPEVQALWREVDEAHRAHGSATRKQVRSEQE